MVDNPLVTFSIHSKGNKICKGKFPNIILKLSNFVVFFNELPLSSLFKNFFVIDPFIYIYLKITNIGINLPKICIIIPKIKIIRLCLVKKSVGNSFFILISDSASYLKVTLWLKKLVKIYEKISDTSLQLSNWNWISNDQQLSYIG